MKTIPITREGLEDFKKEYKELLLQRQPAVDELRTAREMGDLSENAAYKVARQKLSSIDSRLRKLSFILKSAKVQEREFKGVVDFNTKITLESGGQTFVYKIVGGFESDPSKSKISASSPIGKAIMGKKEGENIKVNIPNGEAVYKILKIEPV